MFGTQTTRVSLFIPEWMEELLTVMSASQQVQKADIVRRAVYRALERYVSALEPEGHGDLEPFVIEIPDNEARDLYRRFGALNESFPKDMQLKGF